MAGITSSPSTVSPRRLLMTIAGIASVIAASMPEPTPIAAAAPSGGGTPAASSGPGRSHGPASERREIAQRRTRTSRTFATGRGTFETQVSGGSLNYRDAQGSWQPIDDTLVPAAVPSYAATNRANRYRVLLPGDLGAAPVRATLGASSLAFALRGAHAAAAVHGTTATYARALGGVTVAYSAVSDGVKETVTLERPAAPASFVFDLGTSPDVTARAGSDGGIDLVDRAGRVPFRLAPPTMHDSAASPAGASGPVRLVLAGSGSNQTVELLADRTWLASPARRWPVVIDPSVQFTDYNYWGVSGDQDCILVNTSPTTSSCMAGNSDSVGYNGTSIDRDVLLFDILNGGYTSGITNANIVDASLELDVTSSTSSSAVPVGLYQVTQSWASGATWNTSDGTHAWTTAGGTYNATAIDTVSVGPAAGFYTWHHLTSLVQGWVNGSTANQGFLVKGTNEGTNGLLQFYSSAYATNADEPTLNVEWEPWTGEQQRFKYERHKLSDRVDLAVNVANGNLAVHANDLTIEGTGLDLAVDRLYNNLSNDTWHVGNSWNVSVGCDVNLELGLPDGIVYDAPDGYSVLFTNNGRGGWTTPAGINADLVKNGDGTYTLTFHSNGGKYNFQTGGCLQSEVDRNGNTLQMSYNGSLASVTDTQGRVTTFTYASPVNSDLISQIQDSTGRTWQYGYDSNSNLTSYTDPANKTTQYGYDANNQLTQIIDPAGNTVKFVYDTSYRVTQVQYVDASACTGGSCTTSFTYNTGAGSCPQSAHAFGNTVVTDGDGHTTTDCYDNLGRVTAVIDPLGHQRQVSYTANSDASSLTDGVSQVTSLTHDLNNNLTQISAPGSAQGQTAASTSFTYPSFSQGNMLSYQPTSTTDAQNNCRAFTYDTAGNMTNVYDGQADPNRTGCAGLSGGTHLCNANQGDPSGTCGATATVSCGAKSGELCWSKDGKANQTSYSYDSNGNVTRVTPPSPLGATSIVPDALSRPSSVTDGKGQKTTYTYDNLDRVTQILYNGVTSCSSSSTCTTFVYDGDGNLTSRTDPTGTVTFQYDHLNRLTLKSVTDSSTGCSGSSPAGLTFTYDNASNLTASCDSGGTVSYGYDAANRLTKLAEPTGTCTAPTSLCTTFAYDNDDRRTTTTFPNGTVAGATLTAAYDNAGNETSIVGKDVNGTVLTKFSYTYTSGTQDRALRQTMAEADPVATATTTYSYDAFNQLTQAATTPGSTLKYSYDAAGNRCRTDGAACGTGDTYTYNAANELTASPGVTSYSFDANGNETGTSAGASLSYNPKNQTTAITYNGSTLSPLTYADVDQTERTVAGSATYTSGPLGLAVSKSGSSTTYFLRDNKGELVGQRNPDGSHWYFLKDGIGSVVAVINGPGTTVGHRYGYEPFGKSSYDNGGSIATPWRFAGGYLDGTGLYKFGARYYDAVLGRWSQEDLVSGAMVKPSTTNRYVYAGAEPVDRTDPSGAWFIDFNVTACLGVCVSAGFTANLDASPGDVLHGYVGGGIGTPGVSASEGIGTGTVGSGSACAQASASWFLGIAAGVCGPSGTGYAGLSASFPPAASLTGFGVF